MDSDLFLHPSDNLERLVVQFHDTLRALLDRHAPDKRKQIRARPSAPWMTDEIRYAKRKKRRAERRWRASKTPTNLALFLSQRNGVTYLMTKARQESYTSFIDEISNDQRKLLKARDRFLISLRVLPSLLVQFIKFWPMNSLFRRMLEQSL